MEQHKKQQKNVFFGSACIVNIECGIRHFPLSHKNAIRTKVERNILEVVARSKIKKHNAIPNDKVSEKLME